MLSEHEITFFEENGYLVVPNFLTHAEVAQMRALYDDFVEGRIDVQGHRSDLSGADTAIGNEKIIQIMRPSLIVETLHQSPIHERALRLAQCLIGDDMEMDFDMLIDKPVHSTAITPWHQDEAYWVDMPDKRAVSCWVALDDVVKENGCMWFVPGSHKGPLRAHHQVGNKGALECMAHESEAVAAQIPAGFCTFHHGRTLHYSRGNSTNTRRRAFIVNYRPQTMVAYERSLGFDHLGTRENRNQTAALK